MLLPAEYVKRTGKLCHLTDLGNKNEDPRGRKVTSKCGFLASGRLLFNLQVHTVE
jgi:hypothetical protein